MTTLRDDLCVFLHRFESVTCKIFTGPKMFWTNENETCSLCPIHFSIRLAVLKTNQIMPHVHF
jgi:hypothetical protein